VPKGTGKEAISANCRDIENNFSKIMKCAKR
jgi:hypothetical protein